MKPIAIFRHYPTEGPGYFATFLERQGLPWTLIKIDVGEPVPLDPKAFAGLVFMGGPMSVNDDLPWIPQAAQLIRRAVDEDVPVLGHCLGGQLMAKALGGKVTRNPVKEIGWGEVEAVNGAVARQWLGDHLSFDAFHWHGETFTIPENATRILSSRYCPNQAFILGKHLGMQCHVEMTEELIRSWCETGAREIAQNLGPSVQSVQEIQRDLSARLAALHRIADVLYARWSAGLKG